jgi:predicted ATPase/DNA-binding XRE family transcriptional regulator
MTPLPHRQPLRQSHPKQPEDPPSFGAWFRQRRRALDLTQEELAHRIGCARITIRRIEADELKPSKALAELFAEHFGVPLAQRQEWLQFARGLGPFPPFNTSEPPGASPIPPLQEPSASGLSHPDLLLQLTPFIGRTAELSELARLLEDPTCRLLTIVGPGGMGKSRLALAAMQQMLTGELAQVYFVPLAALPAEGSLAAAMLAAMGYPMQPDGRTLEQQLADHLRQKHLMLVLDNFEHLLESAGFINDLLYAAPGLRVLVTSRERLQLSNETVFTLGGLEYPSQPTTDNVSEYNAVKLFVQTACRVRPDFIMDKEAATAVTQICQLVAGMPLGIILAAAWVDLLSPHEIRQQISHSLDFLETKWRDMPERQRSIRAVFAHTWGRLTESERSVFMRLAVFRDGFTRLAAECVTQASLRTLNALVNKSLVQCEPSGRFTIHELLRQYAEAELKAAGQMAAVRTAHCAYYTEYLHQRETDIKSFRQVAALDEIMDDFENVRAAWQWAVTKREYAAMERTLEALYWFCEIRHRFQEGLELLCLAREQLAPAVGETPHPTWGRVMARMLGQDSTFYEPLLESRVRIETGLAIARQVEDQAEIAFCLWRLAVVLYLSGEPIAAIPYFEESLAHYQALGDHFYQGYLLKDLSILYITLDQPERGDTLMQQSLHVRRETGDLDGLATSLGAMGWICYNRGEYTEAESCWQEAHQLRSMSRARHLLAGIYFESAWLALFHHGDLARVQALAVEQQRIAVTIADPSSKHRSLVINGFLAGVYEEYHVCRHLFQQRHLVNHTYFSYTDSWEQMGLCLAACGLDDLAAARHHLQIVLQISLRHQWPPNAAKGLTFAAIIAAKSDRAERAAELLGLVFHHPLSPKGWLTQWPLLARLRTALATTLTPDDFEAAWRRGATLDLLPTAATELALLV